MGAKKSANIGEDNEKARKNAFHFTFLRYGNLSMIITHSNQNLFLSETY